MQQALLRSLLPYIVGLAIAVALYIYAGTIEYTHRGTSSGLRSGRASPSC